MFKIVTLTKNLLTPKFYKYEKHSDKKRLPKLTAFLLYFISKD